VGMGAEERLGIYELRPHLKWGSDLRFLQTQHSSLLIRLPVLNCNENCIGTDRKSDPHFKWGRIS